MPKIETLQSITAGLAGTDTLNANLTKITTALNNTVSRDGSTPNTMTADLDFNSNKIINAADPVDNQDYATKAYVDAGDAANQGPTGPTGPAGADGADGASFTWQGPWVTATSYALNDVVSEDGSSYICISAHTSGTFATDLSSNYWELVAQQGAAGAGTGDMLAANNLSDVANAATSRSNLGLGTIATQASNSVAITGGAIDGTAIGGTTKAAGAFSSLALNTGATGITAILDEDTMSSDSATALATQQSIKAYVDNAAGSGGLFKVTTFTANGTFTPDGATNYVEVEMVGGGGGGKGATNSTGNGGNGGTTSFGSLLTALGGSGCTAVGTGGAGGTGGTGGGTGTTYHIRGGKGGSGNASRDELMNGGGGSFFGTNSEWSSYNNGPYGIGGSGGTYFSGNDCAGGGGGGEYAYGFFPIADLGATETVTIGAAGTAGGNGTAGIIGFMIVREYK